MSEVKEKYPWLAASAPPPKQRFRPGQWVAFKPATSIEGAGTLDTGEVVGIFHPAATEVLPLVINDKMTPEERAEAERKSIRHTVDRVYVVAPNGNNVPYVDGGGNVHLAVWFPVEACPGVRAITNRDHIPQARVKDNPDWTPKP